MKGEILIFHQSFEFLCLIYLDFFLDLDTVVVVILVVIINQDGEVVVDILLTVAGNSINIFLVNLSFLFVIIFSGSKRSSSDYNSRGGGGKNKFFLSLVCRFLNFKN